jgi:hypothetical protein
MSKEVPLSKRPGDIAILAFFAVNILVITYVVSTVSRFVEQTWTSAVRAALIQSSFPSVPATFREVIGSGHVLERMWSGTSPLWTSS